MLKGGELTLYRGVMYRIDFSWRNHSSQCQCCMIVLIMRLRYIRILIPEKAWALHYS